LDIGNFDECLSLVEIVLSKYPENTIAIEYKIEANIKKAEEYVNKGDWKRALMLWDSVLVDSPANEVALVGREMAQKNLSQSLSTSKSKNRAPVINKILAGKRELSQQEKTWLKVDAYDPDGDRLYYKWSTIYGNIEGEGKSVTYVAPQAVEKDRTENVSAIVKDSKNHDTRYSLSLSLTSGKPVLKLTQQQKDKAAELYRQAYQEEMDYQNTSRAIELYKQVLTTAPDPDFEYYKRANERLLKLKKN